MKLIDVTLPLSANLPTYPGNATFGLEPVKRMAEGASSNVSIMRLGTHTGTHIDAPRHFFDEGAGAEALPLEILMGRCRVIEIPTRRGIGPEHFAGLDLNEDIRLLIKTPNSGLWRSKEFTPEYAFLTEGGARHLVDHGIKLVGVDYLSVEEFKKPGAPAHRVLLGAGAIIIEGLNLEEVEPGIYELFCLPLPVVGGDGAPARVVLRRSAGN